MTNAFIVSRILNLFQKSRERKGSKRFASRILGVSVLTMIVLVAGCANTPAPSAPVITTNPTTSLTVTAGATATFTAAASGTPTPTVQWMVSTGGGAFTAVAGATSATLSFTTTAAQTGNSYEAVFTNTQGSATTTAATLTVNTLPVITTNPTNVSVLAGAMATFTAAATGSPAPTVQWQVSTNAGVTFTNLAGATTVTLSFATAAAQNGNQYKAVFTNAAGSTSTTAATLTVLAPALSIVKSHAGNFTVGTNGVFTIAVSNSGNSPTTGSITVTDTLAAGLTFVSGTGTNWGCAAVLQVVTCTNAGPIAAASAAGNITLTVAVALNAPASIGNTAIAATAGSANASSTDTVTVLSPDLAIAVSHSGSFTAGLNGVFTIAVSNVGTAPSSGTITVTDTLDNNFSFASAAGTGWGCVNVAQVVTCTNAGPIANGASAGNITLTVLVSAAAPAGNLSDTAVVATTGDNNVANNTSTNTVAIAAAPDLAIVKTGSSIFVAGTNATFQIAVNNVSTGPTVGGITVTDTLNANFTFVSGTGTGWACSAVAQLVTCTNSGPIAGSASAANIVLTVAVNAAATGSIPNTATVQTTDDNNAANNSSTATVTVTATAPDLSITKTTSGAFVAGSNGTFQIAVSNIGTAATAGTITVTDTLNAAFTFVSGTGTNWTCAAVLQLVTCTNPGPIANGAAAGNITLTVGISGAASGSIANTGTVADAGDTTDVADKTSTVNANVGSGTTASVQITNPQSQPQPIPLGTGGIVNFIATITNGANGVGVNWTVNGIAGGSSTVGTITPSTTSGATQQAMYTAPASVPGTGGTITITATYAGAGGAQATATINLVANVDSNLPAGQYAFQTRGFTAAGLPVGMVGTFTSNGTGGLSNVLIDTVTVNAGGNGNSGSTATSKVAWNGTYAMDTANHGLINLTLASNASVQMNFGFVVIGGNGSLVELDPPLGSTAFGSFSSASSSSFVLGSGGVNGPFVLRLDGPGAPGSGNISSAVIGQLTVAQTGSSTTAGTITGSFTDNHGNASSTVAPSTITMDADGSGHGTVSLTLNGTNGSPTLSFYVSDSGKIYLIETDSNNEVQTGMLRSQTIPAGGFTTANALSSAMIFEAMGVYANPGHASVIIGAFSPNTSGQITAGEYDASDGGTIPAGPPVQLTGTFALTGPAPGQGTLTLTNGGTTIISFVFYLRQAGEAFILEQPNGGVTERRVGQMGTQTEPVGGFTNATLNGITNTVGTQTTTAASVNGVAVVQFGTGTYAGSSADGSALGQSPFIGGTSTGALNFTDSVRGRGTLTPTGTGSIFGAASVVFYAIDNTGAAILISVDPTILEPQIIIVGH